MSSKRQKLLSFWVLLSISVITYCIGDTLLKLGNMELGSTFNDLLQGNFWIAFIENIVIILAFSFVVFSKLVMGLVLSKNPLGYTEGIFLALAVLVTFLIGVFFFKEFINPVKLLGTGLIATGIIFMFNNHDSDELKV